MHDDNHSCSRCLDASLRVAQTEEERVRVFRFRYDVYVKELGRGVNLADHERGELRDEMDATARILYAEQDDRITGTVRWNRLSETTPPSAWREWYQLDRFQFLPAFMLSVTSKLMVVPEQRGSRLGLRLAVATYLEGLRSNIQLNFIHTSADLVPFFERLGYHQLNGTIHDPHAGERTPMYLSLLNIEHLRKMRSPFTDHCDNHLKRLEALATL